jgi:hypothetical protein
MVAGVSVYRCNITRVFVVASIKDLRAPMLKWRL